MINLGFDILLSTFDLLAQEDKLECMIVCLQWYNIIYTHSLFRDIYIYNQKQLDLLMVRVERDPAVGEKVETLVVEMLCDLSFDRNRFPELFPNLRYYALKDTIRFTDSLIRVEPRQTHPWCRHIEQIEGMESTLIILLSSGVCKNLTFISMKEDLGSSERDFIELLTNAPNLKILDIRRNKISFQDFELLHNTVPLLESLWLKSCYFHYAHIPHGMIPAISVKSLRYSDLRFDLLFESREFFSFISQKYTHMEELTLDDFYAVSEQDIIAVTSYVKTLGPRLKSFSFIFDWEKLELNGTFDFDTMFTGGCQIEKLELGNNVGLLTFERLAKNAQAKHIRSLTISGIAYIQAVESCSFSFSWLLRFTSLKELQLSSFPNDILILNTTDLLEKLCETRLEHLRVHDVHLRSNESSRIPAYPSLRSLALEDATFGKGIDAFISGAFPNLKRLALEFPRRLKESLMCPNLDLSYLEMINSTKEETFPVMVITLDDGQQRLYDAHTKDRMSRYDRANPLDNQLHFSSTYCQSFDKSDIIPMLTITCHSVYDFNLLAYKIR